MTPLWFVSAFVPKEITVPSSLKVWWVKISVKDLGTYKNKYFFAIAWSVVNWISCSYTFFFVQYIRYFETNNYSIGIHWFKKKDFHLVLLVYYFLVGAEPTQKY